VRRIVESLRPYAVDRLYGAFAGRWVERDAQAVIERSAERQLRFMAE